MLTHRIMKDSLPPRTVVIDAEKMWSMITTTPDPNKLFLVIFSLNSFGGRLVFLKKRHRVL